MRSHELRRDAPRRARRPARARASRRPASRRCPAARPRAGRRAPRPPPARCDRVVLEVDQHRHVHLVAEAVGELARREHRVAAVGRDQRVRHGADPAPAPPGGLRVGGDADRPGDVRRPAVAGLHEPVIVAGGEVEDRLAARGGHDVADVAHDQRAAGQRAEVDGLQVREERVVALDREHRLPRADLVALVERVHVELVPAGMPAAVLAPAPGAELEDRDRLVDAAEHRVLGALEDLHEHARVAAVVLEQPARVDEVGVRVVAVAHALHRQAEHARRQARAGLRRRHGS